MANDQWVLLVDPAWAPSSTQDGAEVAAPPLAAVVGGWLAGEDGAVGRFEANPAYVPSGPGSPTDPLDAVLRLVARGEADAAQLAAILRESTVSVALDVDDEPLVAPSPDNLPCVLATTAPAHRTRVRATGWHPVAAHDLPALLDTHDGVDLLLNPGAPGCTRLLADTIRDALAG
ncbi:type VII secretion system-associated protein [Amycolatopsis rhabdoformis]|uniref:Type VII secretion system-associated protein n=1 Tax=Amycolatopsis rhabdoformis TaxID=1448059 RepID=A0ABZ1I0T7_9PSEU|nr:type VII secretion system-associated protein [Amycolatopsis rhabdoformis]WSE27989.1 type VII secretion system-associated protein [Amycolatopsis rhabdoformis]